MENHHNRVKENEEREALRRERHVATITTTNNNSNNNKNIGNIISKNNTNDHHNKNNNSNDILTNSSNCSNPQNPRITPSNKRTLGARSSTASINRSSFSSSSPSLSSSKSEVTTFSSSQNGACIEPERDEETVEAHRISGLVREITKIRKDMFANKKIDIMRTRVSFPEMLRHLQEKEKSGTESETYTDGTCVLLRRKMQRLRKTPNPEPEIEVYALLGQSKPASQCSGSMSSKVGGSPQRPAARKRQTVSQSNSSSNPRLPSISSNKSASSMSAIARYVLEFFFFFKYI